MTEDEAAELVDVEEASWLDIGTLHWRSLVSSPGLLAIAGVVTSLVVVFGSGDDDGVTRRVLGAGLVLSGVIQARRARNHQRHRKDASSPSQPSAGVPLVFDLVVAAMVSLSGLALLAVGARSTATVGTLVGLAVAMVGVLQLLRSFRVASARRVTRATAIAFLAVGGLIATFPDELLSFAIHAGAAGWLLVSVVTVALLLGDETGLVRTQAGTVALVLTGLENKPRSTASREELYDKVFFEGPTARGRVVRFGLLMSFASVIASMGIITDSTAVVIGAMLIAPLMTPLMAMAISLAMGWPARLARSAALALAGVVLAIGIGVVLGLLVPTVIDPSTNAQIVSRASPTILDLITAVAAGAAGAYGLSRADVADALPGVAIAISLVPPLAAVGISYSQGDFRSGTGALLLFATNMVAILVVGGLTFVLTGVVPPRQVAANQRRVRTAIAAVATGAALILFGLLGQGAIIARDGLESGEVATVTADWLGGESEYELVESSIRDELVEVTIAGPSDAHPDPDTLADDLAAALGRPIDLVLRLVVQERIQVSADG